MFSGKVLSRNVDMNHKFVRKYLESPGKWWLHKRYIICSETKECCNYNVIMPHTYYKGKYPQNWYHHIWRETNLQLHCGEVSSPKTTTWTLWKVSTLQRKSLLTAGNCMGNLPKSCSSEPHIPLSFMQKPYPGWAPSFSKKQNCRSEKTRLVHLGTLLELWNKSSMDLVLVPVLAGMGAFVLGFKVWMMPLIWHQVC